MLAEDKSRVVAGRRWAYFCRAYSAEVPRFDPGPLSSALQVEAANAAAFPGSQHQERAPAHGPTDPFTDFTQHQRKLLLTLWNKGKVRIKTALKTLYTTDSDDRLEALKQLIKRTNKKLATVDMVERYEVRRRGEFLELGKV